MPFLHPGALTWVGFQGSPAVTWWGQEQDPGPAASPVPSQTQLSKPRLLLELPQQSGDVGVVAPGDVSKVMAPPSPTQLSVTS